MELARHILQMTCYMLGGMSVGLGSLGIYFHVEDYCADRPLRRDRDFFLVAACLLAGIVLLVCRWLL